MFDVICVGGATVDRFFKVDQGIKDINKGDKVLAKDYVIHSGGGATNAAAALSKFGLKVGVICKLGLDHDADYIIRELKEFNVKLLTKKRSRYHTNNSVIISSKKDKDRVIFVNKDASSQLNEDDVPYSLIKKTKWVYLGSVSGKTEKTAKQIIKYAKKNKIRVMFNPSAYFSKQGAKKLKPLLLASDIIILNKEEAQLLLADKKSKITGLLKKLHALGPKLVIITNSKKRLYTYNGDKMYSLMPPDVKIVDTAGAGDAFNSGFLAGVIKNYNLEDSLCIGQVISTSVIRHIGTKYKLLTEKEVKRDLKKFKIKVKKEKC